MSIKDMYKISIEVKSKVDRIEVEQIAKYL